MISVFSFGQFAAYYAARLPRTVKGMDKGRMLTVKKTKELFADPGTREAATITGCKNIADAKKAGDYKVYVPAWDILLKTAKPIRDDLAGIGVRAHFFSPEIQENSFPVQFGREMEEPFEWVSEFRYEGQADDASPLWWRYPKDKRLDQPPSRLGVSPDDILLLYP